MNSTLEVIDVRSKCHKLSMEKRKETVYELARWSSGAADVLQTWSRHDILQILCAEMGKERKYTGLTKLKIIEQLLKLVSEKSRGDDQTVVCDKQSSKRPRKPENVSRILESASATNISALDVETESGTVTTYCKNAACRARLNVEDVFCKRCSCCVCHKYDDNKDPSLWLTCSSEDLFPSDSCNMSCHVECAIKHARSGIAKSRLVAKLDGEFYCVSCGKLNDLMRCWRKQLMVAKETRRVDILCYRISLSQKLLSKTQKYRNLSKTVDDVVRLLEAEVGTLSGGPVKMGRGIVNRLSSGQKVQRLCASAMESFDSITCHTTLPNNSSSNDVTNLSSLTNPVSVEDETTNITTCCDLNATKTEDYFGYYETGNKTVAPNGQIDNVISTETCLPITPSRKESLRDGITRKRRSKSPRKGQHNDLTKEDNSTSNLEYYIKTVRWLECEGHIDGNFRQKFLTWYSVRATTQECRVVKAFIDTLVNDPVSLSEQLVDTFGEIVSSKRSSDVTHGFCLKPWH